MTIHQFILRYGINKMKINKNTYFLIPALFLFLCTSCTSTDSILIREGQTDNTTTSSAMPQPLADVVVNIEGIITQVSKDGKSFRLDNGKWIITDRQTIMGITGSTAAPKDEQYLESTFRIGNSIAGFSETPEGEIIVAYAIYTNWNW